MSDKYITVKKNVFGGVFKSDILWEEATTHHYENYQFNSETVTLLNGDAAPWIAKGIDLISDIIALSLADFHWNRKIRQLLGRSRFVPGIYQAIKEDNKKMLLEVLNKAKSYRQKKRRQKQN